MFDSTAPTEDVATLGRREDGHRAPGRAPPFDLGCEKRIHAYLADVLEKAGLDPEQDTPSEEIAA